MAICEAEPTAGLRRPGKTTNPPIEWRDTYCSSIADSSTEMDFMRFLWNLYAVGPARLSAAEIDAVSLHPRPATRLACPNQGQATLVEGQGVTHHP